MAVWARPGWSWWIGGKIVCLRLDSWLELGTAETGGMRSGGEGIFCCGDGRSDGRCGELSGTMIGIED